MVIQSVKSVFTLMVLIMTGYVFTGKKWFGKSGSDFLSKFTVQVTVPCFVFYNMYVDVASREALLDLFSKLPVTFGSILVSLLAVAIVGKICHVDPVRKGTFVAAAGFSNVVFIGFPVIQSLWGESITSIGVIYYMSSTLLFWTVGIALLRKDCKTKVTGKDAWKQDLKKIFAPPMIALIAGIVVVLLQIPIPDIVLSPMKLLKSITSPLAMVFIGSVIRTMDLKSLKFGRDLYLALAVRFIILPVITVFYLNCWPIPGRMKEVFFVLAAMPSMTQMGIMAREYESDYEFACTVIATTTFISLLTIPLFMYILTEFSVFGA